MNKIIEDPSDSFDLNVFNQNRGKIKSSKGGWKIGHGVVCHGFDMMHDFVGKKSYMQVLVLNATGKLPSDELGKWFDAIHICLSWPDPRIWCNQISALSGTVRCSPVAATVAGILANDSRSYGSGTLKEGANFIQGALRKHKYDDKSVVNIVEYECSQRGGKPQIMGYARPIAKGDERVGAMSEMARSVGLEMGEHLSLAFEIEKYLLDRYDESMNINGYMSGFLSDQGFTPEEIYRIFSILVASGATACYVDTRDKPAETFLPLHCDDIDYQGHAPRDVPEEIAE